MVEKNLSQAEKMFECFEEIAPAWQKHPEAIKGSK